MLDSWNQIREVITHELSKWLCVFFFIHQKSFSCHLLLLNEDLLTFKNNYVVVMMWSKSDRTFINWFIVCSKLEADKEHVAGAGSAWADTCIYFLSGSSVGRSRCAVQRLYFLTRVMWRIAQKKNKPWACRTHKPTVHEPPRPVVLQITGLSPVY